MHGIKLIIVVMIASLLYSFRTSDEFNRFLRINEECIETSRTQCSVRTYWNISENRIIREYRMIVSNKFPEQYFYTNIKHGMYDCYHVNCDRSPEIQSNVCIEYAFEEMGTYFREKAGWMMLTGTLMIIGLPMWIGFMRIRR
jgi:hypothetical protein